MSIPDVIGCTCESWKPGRTILPSSSTTRGFWSDERRGVAVGADKDDAAVADGDRLGPTAGRVHGVDRAVAQHEIGGLRRNERKNERCEYVHVRLPRKI